MTPGKSRPARRKALPQPLPQAGGEWWGSLGRRGKDNGMAAAANLLLPRLRGRPGGGPAAVRLGKGPSRRGTLPQPLPQAGGERRGNLGKWRRDNGTAAAAAILLLPRLRGRPGGGRRPGGLAKARRAEGPSPNPSRKREGSRKETAAAGKLLLPRLPGRPGGGQRPGGKKKDDGQPPQAAGECVGTTPGRKRGLRVRRKKAASPAGEAARFPSLRRR